MNRLSGRGKSEEKERAKKTKGENEGRDSAKRRSARFARRFLFVRFPHCGAWSQAIVCHVH